MDLKRENEKLNKKALTENKDEKTIGTSAIILACVAIFVLSLMFISIIFLTLS